MLLPRDEREVVTINVTAHLSGTMKEVARLRLPHRETPHPGSQLCAASLVLDMVFMRLPHKCFSPGSCSSIGSMA